MASLPKDPKYDVPLMPASKAEYIAAASTRCNAPAALVFHTLRNTDTWKDWCRYVPRVLIREQPPEDDATEAEIEELIRDTSVALTFDSDLSEVNPNQPRRESVVENKDDPSAHLTVTQRFQQRRASHASGMSTGETNGQRDSLAPPADPRTSGRRKSYASTMSTREKRRRRIFAMYGEQSVRICEGTVMTFHCRMKLPESTVASKYIDVVVTEVSRPEDPIHPEYKLGLQRAHTHTITTTGVYRIVWHAQDKFDPPRAYPKFMWQAQRVHEIRPIKRGDGTEECEISTWECQRGPISKIVRQQYGAYIQDRFQEWVDGLRNYCEAMGGKVERRDFGDSS